MFGGVNVKLPGAVAVLLAAGLLRLTTGKAPGITLFDADDAAPVPTALVAVTVKVYAVPLVNPVTAIDLQGALQPLNRLPGEEVAV